MSLALFWFCVISFNTAMISTYKLYYAKHETTKVSEAIRHTLSAVVNGVLIYSIPNGHQAAWVLAFCIGFSFVLDCFMPKALDSFVGLTCKDKSKKDVAVSDSKAK